MNLNVLEYLGVIMIFFVVFIAAICLYYSRCGRSLNATKSNFDPIKFKQECKLSLLSSNDYRERASKLGCESCKYFLKQCDTITGNFAPEIFETNCKYRSEVTADEMQIY